MLLSQTTEYALRAVLQIARRPQPGPVRAVEIAAELGVPANYLSKTLHQLARAGVLTSSRGPAGGFRLAVPPHELTLRDVVSTFEPAKPRRCLIGHGICGDSPACPVHARWAPIASVLDAFFANTTVGEFIRISPPHEVSQ